MISEWQKAAVHCQCELFVWRQVEDGWNGWQIRPRVELLVTIGNGSQTNHQTFKYPVLKGLVFIVCQRIYCLARRSIAQRISR